MILILKEAWRFIGPYWKSDQRFKASGLLVGIIFSVVVGIYIQVLLNEWQRTTFDALQNFNVGFFASQISYFFYCLFFFVCFAMLQTYFQQKLVITWREWLTNQLLDRWLAKKNYYKMGLFKTHTDNPDQRISQDVSEFVSLTESLFIDSIDKILTLGTFSVLLWSISINFPIPTIVPLIGGHVFPGFLLWVALGYAILGTYISFKFGASLVTLMFNKEKLEANFRFAMMRLRENAESIALYNAHGAEKSRLMTRYLGILGNMYRVMYWNIRYFLWINFSLNISTILPILLASPMYFAKQIQFGGIMQITGAMGQVQSSILHFSQILPTLATWRAACIRLSTFLNDLNTIEEACLQTSCIQVTTVKNPEDPIIITLSRIDLPTRQQLFAPVDMTLTPGEPVLLKGPSGTGKSTFLHVLAGLWPLGEGQLAMPQQTSLLFVPQRPYIPSGTLREVIEYPYAAQRQSALSDQRITEILKTVGLEKFADQLRRPIEWSKQLSLGEQQKISFARLFLHKPKWAFLDEITSALDEAAEKKLYGLLKKECPNTTFVSVGHRSTIAPFHRHSLYFDNDNAQKITYIRKGE